MKTTVESLIRWSGPAALIAGVSYALVGVFHPPNILASVTTPTWLVVHVLAMSMSIFGLLGLTGLYAKQAEKSGWLGLAGYLLLTLWLALILGFTFVEVPEASHNDFPGLEERVAREVFKWNEKASPRRGEASPP